MPFPAGNGLNPGDALRRVRELDDQSTVPTVFDPDNAGRTHTLSYAWGMKKVPAIGSTDLWQ
jgi:hypothetical protein